MKDQMPKKAGFGSVDVKDVVAGQFSCGMTWMINDLFESLVVVHPKLL